VQALRGISAIAVLVYHLAAREVQDWPDGQGHVFSPFFSFNSFGVDLFFVISGFVITSASLKDFGRPDRILGFLKKRFYRIFPIYWLTCLPILAWSIFHHGTGWFYSLASLLLVPGYARVVNPVSWSLVYEVLFYAIFAVIMFAPARFLPVFISLWAIAIGAYYFDPEHLLPRWIYSYVLFSLSNFSFMFGIVIALFAGINRVFFPRSAIISGIALLVLGAFANAHGYGGYVHLWPNRVIFIEVAAACIVYGAVGLELQGTVWSSRLFQTIGDASYSIYLVHYMVVMALMPFYPAIQGSLVRTCWATSAFALALGAGLLTYFYFERPMLRLFKERTSSQKRRNLEAAPEPAAPRTLVGA
jgi:peptidoglycan/LPS O-acetylase OafA/YrhL